MKRRIGFIGLGTMGRPMAENLLKAGFDLTVYARRPEPAQEMVKLGATSAGSPAAVAQKSEIVVTIVTADRDVEEVILGEQGVLGRMSDGGIIADMSTIMPSTIRRIGETAAARGVQILDAPVSGGDTGAQAGTLSIMVGGDANALEACRPIFEAMGENIFHVGGPGMGQTAKIVNNLLGGITMAAIGEAFAMGVKAGADPEVLFQVVEKSSGNSAVLQARIGHLLRGDREPGFMLDLMKKDIGLALNMGKELESPLPLGAIAYQLYSGASVKGLGRKDMVAVCALLEELAGVQIAREE